MTLLDRRTARVLLTILVFALGLAVVYVVRAVIIIFAFSILFAYLINPVVRFLQRHSLFFKNLRGPHVVEAYLAFIIVIALVFHGVAPQLHRNLARFLDEIPALSDKVSDTQATRIRTFLQQHRATIESSVEEIGRFASTAVAGILVIPILAIFFLTDGENLSNQIIRLVSPKENYATMQSLAGELHVMLQHYIRTKVILGGLSLSYCSVAMLVLGFPNAVTLGVLAGILEFIQWPAG